MNVRINGEAREMDTGLVIAAFVDRELSGRSKDGVAVAINGEVLRRSDWNQKTLNDGDAVEILEAVCGG